MRVTVLVFAVELQKVSAHHLSTLRFLRGLFKTACTWRVKEALKNTILSYFMEFTTR